MLCAVCGIGVFVAEHHGLTAFDRWGGHLITLRSGSTAFRLVADIGNPLVVAAVVICAAVVWTIRHDWGLAVVAIVGPVAAGILTVLIFKPLIDRTGVVLTYPSGHTTGASALVTVAVLTSVRRRMWAAVAGALVVVANAIAVIILGWHTVTEALAGILVGCGSVLSTVGGLKILRGRRERTTSPKRAAN